MKRFDILFTYLFVSLFAFVILVVLDLIFVFNR